MGLLSRLQKQAAKELLDLSAAGRSARMQEQGYAKDWWHSGAIDDVFDPAKGELGLHIGSKSAAQGAARQAWRQRRLGARSDAPASADPIEPREFAVRGTYAVTPDIEDFADPFDYLKARNSASTSGWWDRRYSDMWRELDDVAKAAYRNNDSSGWREAVHAAAKKHGVDGWEYANEFEGGKSRVVFSPDVTRSVNALFDPEESGSNRLLAAVPAAIGGGLLSRWALQPDEDYQV